ncbi:interferon-induced GTP-binding protein Mx1-like [Liolophura sinensis]|uniref:interferon-induced GTP-binding protein Mx1-like n=1 Tax=Liolophura sinensis TaxID=3198878 RepID=UPI0031590894
MATSGLKFHSANEDSATPEESAKSQSSWDTIGQGYVITSLKTSFDQHARPLLDTIDLIRSLGLEGRGFQLPKIVVIGDQSVGKSSCLEALSGIQLPRGDGIVTRTPLEMRMRTARIGTGWRCRIQYKDHKGQHVNTEINNSSEVGEGVKEAQSRIMGDTSGISDSLITLEVESPDVPDLTLIDLPGIARYSEANAQIEQQVLQRKVPVLPWGRTNSECRCNFCRVRERENLAVSRPKQHQAESRYCGLEKRYDPSIIQLIKKFIKSDNTIILAVFPAGTDVDTVAAFRLARDVDPELKRTMGVVTKMDLVGPGSEKFVLDTLNNKKVKLNLGMFAVRCRNQDEVERGIPLQEACRKEEDFFHSHPHFGYLNPSIFGIRRLSEKMVKELTSRIRQCLPEMNRVVSDKLSEIKKDIAELGKGPSTDEEERRREFLSLLTEYTDSIEKVCSGLYRHQENKVKLFSMWREETHTFAHKIREVTELGVKESLERDEGILQTLKMQRGCELPGFVNSFPVCESIISYLLVAWNKPAMEYVAGVRNHVETVLREMATLTFDKYPNLATRVKEIVDERLQIAIQSTESDITKIFDQESTVWTQDGTYVEQLNAVKKSAEKMKPNAAEGEDKLVGWNRYAEDVMDGVSAYMQVASRRIMDTIPQSVHYHTLKVLSAKIKEYVLCIASNPSAIDDLFKEREEIAHRREEMLDLQQRWRRAERQLAAL